MKVTADRRHSPKGRAGLVREWLRQLSEQGIDPVAVEAQIEREGFSLGQLVLRLVNGTSREPDFSHEVMDAMQGCLACKACASSCPVKIDVPNFRSRFAQLYYSRYPRPAKDFLIGYSELYTPWMARVPKLSNLATDNPVSSWAVRNIVGLVDLPRLSVPSLNQSLAGDSALQFDLEYLDGLSPDQRQEYVLIVQDPFTSYYESPLLHDLVKLCRAMDLKPVLLPFKPNGKPLHVKGFLAEFARSANDTADFLNQVGALGIPMIGVDPALVLCYRDEYAISLGKNRGSFEVLMIQEWLEQWIKNQASERDYQPTQWSLMAHCTEKSLSPSTHSDWEKIFRHFSAELETVPVGCCGMAGTYGHDAKNEDNSRAIYKMSWEQALEQRERSRCLATGYSCRSQVKRIQGYRLKHPLQALLQIIQKD